MSSRVAMLVEPRKIELRSEAIPTAPPGGLVVRVRAALTDGTDLKAYRRGHPQMPMPSRFGHEFSGDVAAVGEGTAGYAVGDAVMCVHSAPDGTCFWCLAGEEELCESVMSTKILGAYADYIEIPARIVARNCFHKPDGLAYRDAAFLEPLACVVHSVDYLEPAPDALVAVLGDGGFGLLHAQVLRDRGARPLLIGRRQERLDLSRALGIDTVDARVADVHAAIAARTGDRGADALIECTGSQQVWESAPGFVRRGGTVSFFGGLPASAQVSFQAARLHYDEVRLISPFHFGPPAVARAFELLREGKIAVEPLVTRTFALGDIVEAFATLDGGEGIKFAIEP
ncbi:MAG TPA: alcohol dehydrogenase catalytic domain-containing protein [Candidatus Baltobacteraceae bacterium]